MSEHPLQSGAAEQSDLPEWLREMTDQTARVPGETRVEQKVSPVMISLILIAIGVLGIVAYSLYLRSRGTPNQGPAPAFNVTTWDFEGLAMPGERLSLDSLKGKTIVINFWASWCIPCQQEAPMLERTWNEYKDRGVVFIGVNTDDTDASARAYIEKYGLTYPHAPDGGERMEDAYRITGIPETFVIDGDGQIVEHFISSPKEGEFRDAIDRALKG